MNRKVAIYARVSTEHEAQLSAVDNQVQYYDDILEKHPNWILYDRYIDEGITGTSIKKRKNFIRMLKDAHEGKFDLIIYSLDVSLYLSITSCISLLISCTNTGLF